MYALEERNRIILLYIPPTWRSTSEGPKPATRGGGEWEPIKISSEIQTVGLYPENHPSPQAFWPKFGIAMEKLNQHKRPRTSERNHEANRKRIERNRRTDLPGPVWPVTAVQKLADQSDLSENKLKLDMALEVIHRLDIAQESRLLTDAEFELRKGLKRECSAMRSLRDQGKGRLQE